VNERDEITPVDTGALRELADMDARSGSPLGSARRAAADEIERLRTECADLRERHDALVADWWES